MKWTLYTFPILILVIGLLIFINSYQSKVNILGSTTDVTPSVIIALINLHRSQSNLPALEPEPHLMTAAQAKAADLINRKYFSHISQDQVTPWYFILNSGYQYAAAGENLARNFSNSNNLVDAWMNSPSHQANILNSRYSQIGVAVQANYVVAIFASPLLQASQSSSYYSSTLIDDLAVTSTLLILFLSFIIIFILIYLLYRYLKPLKLFHHYKPSLTLWYS